MDSYEVVLARSVEKDFRRIDRPAVRGLFAALASLADDPMPQGRCVKLRGAARSDRLRVGDYRVLYEVDTPRRVVHVFRVRYRKEVYR